jgi:hypothetical protein
MRVRALLVALVLLASQALLRPDAASASASSWANLTVEVGAQITFSSGACSTANGNPSILICTGSALFADHYGQCSYAIWKTTDPFTGYTWHVSVSPPSCTYQWTGRSSIRVYGRTSQPGPTPTPFIYTATATPAPTPAPAVLTLTVEAPLGYVSGPCTAIPSTGGQLGGPPRYRCTAGGTIHIGAGSKGACTFAIVQPGTTYGAWGVSSTGTCGHALKSGNELDIRPH